QPHVDDGFSGHRRADDLPASRRHPAPSRWHGKPRRRKEAAGEGGQIVKTTVLGAGAWGTALARLLSEGSHAVTMWGHNAGHLERMQREGRNEEYLPSIDLPRDWSYQADAAKAVAGSELVIVAVPSKAFREVTSCLAGFRGVVVSVTKG